MSKRRHAIDGLRTFATYPLSPFRVDEVFDVAPYCCISNVDAWATSPSSSRVLNDLTGSGQLWHIPLFCLLKRWPISVRLAHPRQAQVVRSVPIGFGRRYRAGNTQP